MTEYTDPATTLELLHELETLGFSDRAFSIIHHFEKPEKIASHRKYCEMLREEDARFRTRSNQLVQQRLELLLRIFRAGSFKARSSALFEHLAKAVLLEVPHDRRPLSEQFADPSEKRVR